ncbi:hypothetical protein GCM10009605_02830 [Nocardiopsis composta]
MIAPHTQQPLSPAVARGALFRRRAGPPLPGPAVSGRPLGGEGGKAGFPGDGEGAQSGDAGRAGTQRSAHPRRRFGPVDDGPRPRSGTFRGAGGIPPAFSG